MKDKAELYFANDGLLNEVFESYKMREEQLEFARDIHQAIEEKRSMVGEANTGVGKSLAALSGANTVVEETGRPVVIVTSSILLQEQYMEKDIPIMSKATGVKYGEVIAKGKRNFVCMDKALSSSAKKIAPDYEKELADVLAWAVETKTGDVSELERVPSYPVWKNVSITEENECKGKLCPLYSECHYYKNQRKIQSAKIIVCNYHYYFLALRLPGLLPDEIGAVIFDEFHEVVNISRDILEKRLHMKDFDTMNSMLARTQQKASTLLIPELEDLAFGEEVELGNFMHEKERLFHDLTKWMAGEKERNRDNLIITEKEEETFLEIFAKPYHDNMKRLKKNTNSYIDSLNIDEGALYNDGYSEGFTEWAVSLMKYSDFLSEQVEATEEMINYDREKYLVWVEDKENAMYSEVILKPFDVSEFLFPLFTSDPNARDPRLSESISIGMSATLTANRSFNHFREQIGCEDEDLVESIVSSPFDMENNFLWYLPKDAPEGNERGHNVFVLNEMSAFIEEMKGGVLCLFTSRQRMDEASEHFKGLFAGDGIEILKQGEYSKRVLVEKMRENENVVIVATRSFFTGVDIQGRGLRAVLIDKLPFPMIGDPINEYLMDEPRGFFKFSLPETIITLKQAFGRLIRTSEDFGVVSVMDGRLRTKRYKNRIFNSFDFKTKGTQDRDEAIRFAIEGPVKESEESDE